MYAKLILRNARRSAKDYLVYIVTMTICVMLFYAFLSISSRYYHADVGAEYDFTMLSDGMKMAICAVTLLLLFLIRYVNNYMLRRKQKEFAIQSVMGMEQKTVGLLFFAETFAMGAVSIVIGILLGVICSQFITAMLLTDYGQNYKLSWTLFPDTAFLTVCFFVLILLVVGIFNIRSIQKIKIIDMLSADKQNESHLKKSRWMMAIEIIYGLCSVWMLITGIQKIYFYFDTRFAAPVHIMFWGNIIAPAINLLWLVICLIKKRTFNFQKLILGQMAGAVLSALFTASVPKIQREYYLALGTGAINQYMLFILVDMIFLICGTIYMANSMIAAWKEKSPNHRYSGQNLFFFGQITSKLATTTKTMTIICITLVLSIFLFISAPVLTGWSSGYLDVRSMYDVQINSRYNNVYEETKLPSDDYEPVTDFLDERGMEAGYDCTFNLYLPKREDFHNRIKMDFPIVAISLTDYNKIREMVGYEPVILGENEFTTQWQAIATEDTITDFIKHHDGVTTDAGTLSLAENAYYDESVGQTVYNFYTDVIYVFPDKICQELLPVMRNRYIKTAEKISYDDAAALERIFKEKYPEEPAGGEGAYYEIRTNTMQVNSSHASNFVMKATMIYGAVVLLVICLTILSLQQLLDAVHYKYRFSVLRKLGVGEKSIGRLILKQLSVWFGLPIVVSIVVSIVIVGYFLQTVSVEISTYIGYETLLEQIAITASILVLLLVCYFISTWILFKKSISD